ncbi:phage tail protein [Nonomuraea sp. NPDC002799]
MTALPDTRGPRTAMDPVSADVVRAQTPAGNAAVTAAMGGLPSGTDALPSGWRGEMLLAGQNLVGNQAVATLAGTRPALTAPALTAPAPTAPAPTAPAPTALATAPTTPATVAEKSGTAPAKKKPVAPLEKATAPLAPAPDQKDPGSAKREVQDKGADGKQDAAGPRSPGADPKFQTLKKDVGAKKRRVGSSHPPAKAEAGAAQAASVPPGDDREARGKAAHAEDMDAAQPKEFSKTEFVQAVEAAVAKQAPKNLDEADTFGESGKAEQVKQEVQGKVGEGKETSAKEIADTTRARPKLAPDEKPVVPLTGDKPPGKPGAPNPDQAAPDPLPASATDMSAGPAQVNQQMADAAVTEPQLTKSNEPTFSKAVKDKKAMEAHSATSPGQLRAGEAKEIKQVKAVAATRGAAAMAAMHATRITTGKNVGAGKVSTRTTDEEKRTQVTAVLQEVFDKTKCDVEKILTDLDKMVDDQFTKQEKQARDKFTAEHERGMADYKDRRYSGLKGKARWFKDLFADLPEEANRIYETAKDHYLAAMRLVIADIADTIERELRRAKDRIATGRKDLKAAVDKLPKDLQAIGREAATDFEGKFDELRDTVDDKGTALVDTLATKYKDAVKSVDDEIAAEREKNKGLVSKAADAIGGVIRTIKELGSLLLGVLRKAASAVKAILKDPIGFLGNLVTGVGGGLKLFAKNAGRHLEQGVLAWLLGVGASAGLQLATGFDIVGILTMLAGLLGLSWANIRARLVRKVPEQAVSAAETSIPIVSETKKRGVAGMWPDLKDRVGNLKKDLIGNLVSYLLPTIVIAGITWIVSLFNPASAFIRACKMIIDIIRFIVTNARQIVDFVNAVLDAVIAIARGGSGGVPALVERALAKSIPVLIGALAALLGIGGIAGKVREVFQKLARPVNRAIDWVIDKIVGLVKKLWAKLKAALDRKKRPKKPAKPPRRPVRDRTRPRLPDRRRPKKRRPKKRRPDRRTDRKPDKRSDKAKKRALDAAVRDALKLLRAEDATQESVREGLPGIKRRHRLTSIQLKKFGEDDYAIRVAINPAEETPKVELTEEDFPYEIDKAEKGMTIKRREGAVSQLKATVIPMEGRDRRIGFVVTIATIPSEVKSDMAVRYITTAWEGGSEDLAAARTAVVIGINAMEHLDASKGKTEIDTAIGKVDTRPDLIMAVFGFLWTPNWVRVKKGKRTRVRLSEVRRKFAKLPAGKKSLAQEREKGLRAKEALPFGLFREEVLGSSYVRTATRVLAKMNDVVYGVGQDADTSVTAKNTMGVLAAYVQVLEELGRHPLIVIGGYRFGGFKWRRGDARRRRQLTLWSNEVDHAIRAAINKAHPQMLYPTEPNMLIKLLDLRKGAVKGLFQKLRTRALLRVQGGLFGIGEAEGRFLRNKLMRVFGVEFTLHFAPEVSTVTSSAPGNIPRGLEVTPAHAIAAKQGMTLANERIRVAHEAYVLILQSQTTASAQNLARELVKADADLMRLPEQVRKDFQAQLQDAFFRHVEDIVLIMTDNPRLAADGREVTSRIKSLHRTANKIAKKAVRDSKPKAMVDAIRTAENVAEQIINAMTAEDLRATWSRLHRLLDTIMSEQNQGGGGSS